jgi:hypothetical protein
VLHSQQDSDRQTGEQGFLIRPAGLMSFASLPAELLVSILEMVVLSTANEHEEEDAARTCARVAGVCQAWRTSSGTEVASERVWRPLWRRLFGVRDVLVPVSSIASNSEERQHGLGWGDVQAAGIAWRLRKKNASATTTEGGDVDDEREAVPPVFQGVCLSPHCLAQKTWDWRGAGEPPSPSSSEDEGGNRTSPAGDAGRTSCVTLRNEDDRRRFRRHRARESDVSHLSAVVALHLDDDGNGSYHTCGPAGGDSDWKDQLVQWAEDCEDTDLFFDYTKALRGSLVHVAEASSSSVAVDADPEPARLMRALRLQDIWSFGDPLTYRVSVWGCKGTGKSFVVDEVLSALQKQGWHVEQSSQCEETHVRYSLATPPRGEKSRRIIFRECRWADGRAVVRTHTALSDKFISIDLHIFVVDMTTVCRQHQATYRCLHDSLSGAAGMSIRLWVFANRAGNPSACEPRHIDETMRIHELHACLFYRVLDATVFGVPDRSEDGGASFGTECAKLLGMQLGMTRAWLYHCDMLAEHGGVPFHGKNFPCNDAMTDVCEACGRCVCAGANCTTKPALCHEVTY